MRGMISIDRANVLGCLASYKWDVAALLSLKVRGAAELINIYCMLVSHTHTRTHTHIHTQMQAKMVELATLLGTTRSDAEYQCFRHSQVLRETLTKTEADLAGEIACF